MAGFDGVDNKFYMIDLLVYCKDLLQKFEGLIDMLDLLAKGLNRGLFFEGKAVLKDKRNDLWLEKRGIVLVDGREYMKMPAE